MDSRVVAIIPARYESTRFPGKPLAEIEGKPMIRHVYERTALAERVDRVIVATDDERIRDIVRSFGGESVMTARHHESGTDRIAEVAGGLRSRIIVNVQGDLPFIDPRIIDAAVRPLIEDAELPMATVKTAIRDPEELGNPNVVKVVCTRTGYALYFSRSLIPYRRDGGDAEAGVFRHVGLYVYRCDFLLRFARLEPTPLERAEKLEQLRALEWGFPIKVVEVPEASIEVDTPTQWKEAQAVAAARTREEKEQE